MLMSPCVTAFNSSISPVDNDTPSMQRTTALNNFERPHFAHIPESCLGSMQAPNPNLWQCGYLNNADLPAKPNKSLQKVTITAIIASKKQNKLKHVSQIMMESQNMKRKQGVMTCIAFAQAPLGQLR